MKQIRIGTFETNSSSSHSLIMVSAEELRKWKKEELWCHDGELKTMEKAIEDHLRVNRFYYEKYPTELPPRDDMEAWREYLRDWEGIYSYEEYVEDPDVYEVIKDSYTTKSGEEVVAICRYYAS